MDINGTDGNDVLTGTSGDDVINGLGGNDTIDGGAGNDTLNGGVGDDIVHGGAGDDRITDGGGVGHVYGEDGNDLFSLTVNGGDMYAEGGAGNDIFQLGLYGNAFFSFSYTIDGGTGDDSVLVSSGGVYPATVHNVINLGAGNDRLVFLGGTSDVTLGAGADEIQIGFALGNNNYAPAGGQVYVSDYVPGEDHVTLQLPPGYLLGWDGSTNPFTAGYLSAFQFGNDTILGIDKDGPNGSIGYGFASVIYFRNTSLSALGAADFGGYGVDGSMPAGMVLTGTNGDDGAAVDFGYHLTGALVGGAGADTIAGLGGNDTIYGFAGDDVIDGGAGNDIIYTGLGADIVHGGDGNDGISSDGGNARLYGDAGDDQIIYTLSAAGHAVLDGGDGADYLTLALINFPNGTIGPFPGATASLFGGAGDDIVAFNELITGVPVDLGSGNDVMQLYGAQAVQLTLGDGADEVRLSTYRNAPALAATVADYVPGVDFVSLPSASSGSYFAGLAAGASAFAGGYARIAQSGTDTVLQFDRNGGGDNFVTVARFTGVAATAFGAADFGGFAPNALTPIVISGTSGDDSLKGGDPDETIFGGAGNDSIDGGGGRDLLYGGAGNDSYTVDRQSDLLFENPNEGTDTVISTSNFYLYANIENLTLAAGAGNIFGVGNELDNSITGNEGDNTLLAGTGVDIVHGGAGIDIVYGEDGNDQLFGDAGNDVLIGGNGDDMMDGGAGGDSVYGEAGNDTLYGGTTFEFDRLVGGDGNDVLRGDSGLGDYDYLYGNAGDDSFYVDTGDDLTFEQAGEGIDTVYANVAGTNNGVYLYANIENLVLLGTTTFGVGNELNNVMTGNATANYLLGGAGDDILNGKAGNDVLFGQAGADRFVFEHGTGADVIGDFTPGADKIDLSAIGYTWAQVQNSLHENGGNTAIDLGGGDLIVLNGVTAAQLHAGDFIFAAAASSQLPTNDFAADLHFSPLIEPLPTIISM